MRPAVANCSPAVVFLLESTARGEPEHAGDQHGAENKHERADNRMVHFGFAISSVTTIVPICTA